MGNSKGNEAAWFPLSRDMMENPDFWALTVAEKTWFIETLSQANLRGQYYRADIDVAVRLGLSEIKVRQARRKAERLGFVKYTPGFKSKKGNIATTYHFVRWATPHDPFVKMQRHCWNAMLWLVRKGNFQLADVWVYVNLCYLWGYYGAGQPAGRTDFFVAKSRLAQSTGLRDAPARVHRLYQRFQFHGGGHLFEFRDQYHRFTVTRLAQFSDPSQDPKTQNLAQSFEDQIRRQLLKIRQKQRKVPKKRRRRK